MKFEEGAAIVRQRSLGLCEFCQHAGNQTHHRLPRGMGGVSRAGMFVNKPSNLIRLCTLCHNIAEHEREWAFTVGLLVRRGDDPAERPVWLRSVQGTGWYYLLDDGCLRWVDLPAPCTEPRRV